VVGLSHLVRIDENDYNNVLLHPIKETPLRDTQDVVNVLLHPIKETPLRDTQIGVVILVFSRRKQRV